MADAICPREMATKAVAHYAISIRLACQVFKVSEGCYRYQPVLADENQEIADWLLRLTANQRNWGFDCASCTCTAFWNHKGSTGFIARAQSADKPKKRLAGQAGAVGVPDQPNHCWSMDFGVRPAQRWSFGAVV